MPIEYARRLTGHDRTARSNRHLGFALAFVAGAVNAGAFLAVGQYTSHMTGLVSSMADDLALGHVALALAALGALLSFIAGAALSALMINDSRRRKLRSVFALPLLFEAALLLAFGLLGAQLSGIQGGVVPATIVLLCFMMGLQNAVITKVSQAEIRTTHLTGVVTDIGIELGRLLYGGWRGRRSALEPALAVRANRQRLSTLCLLVLFFFVGGVLGALGFKALGYLATVPLALLLVLLAAMPVLDDLREVLARKRH